MCSTCVELKASPYSLVRQPAGVAVVISIGEGGLQLARRRDGRRVLHAHPIGVGEGQGVAVVRGPVVKHHTWMKEMCVRASGGEYSRNYLWVTDIFMNCNLGPLKHEHVHARRCISTEASRHPHRALTLFHLCGRKQQRSGSGSAYAGLICIDGRRLIIREKRCCPWIQCTTNT